MAEQKNITTYIYLGLILIIFVLIYFLVYPAITGVKDVEKSKLVLEKELSEKEQTLTKFEEVTVKYKEKKGELSKISQMLSQEPDLVFQLIQFENLANTNYMVIEDISFEPLEASEKGSVGVFPINLQVSGNYENFKNFLDSVAKNLNLIDVETISFQPIEAGQGMASAIENNEEIVTVATENKYTFSLKVNTYTQKMPEQSKEETTTEQSEEETIK